MDTDFEDECPELCQTCCGDGIETSDDLMSEDPLWWAGVGSIPCRNCGGSGLMKDQTYF
jgi:DnaJ-class molecular chaperone